MNVKSAVNDAHDCELGEEVVLHVQILEPFLLRESRIAELASGLDFLFHVDLVVDVLHVEARQEFFGFRSVQLNLDVSDVEENIEDFSILMSHSADGQHLDGGEEKDEEEAANYYQELLADELLDSLVGLLLELEGMIDHEGLGSGTVGIEVTDGCQLCGA
jgi:hypothetical protein